MRLIICGDSHVVKIDAALKNDPKKFSDAFPGEIRVGKLFSFPVILSSFFEDIGGSIKFTKGSVNRAFFKLIGKRDFTPDDIVVLSLFFTNTILVRSIHWRTHLPARVWRRGFHPVSDEVMKAIVLEHFRHGISFLEALLSRGLRVMALESPPMRGDDPALRRYIKPSEALEIDRIARTVMRQELARLGVLTIAMPSIAVDADSGFLPQRYHAEREGDYHHANSTLGSVVLEEVLQSAASLGA